MAAIVCVLGGCLGTLASLFGLAFLDFGWSATLTTYALAGLAALSLCAGARLRPAAASEATPQSA